MPIKVLVAGAGETAHWLRTLVVLPEDPSLVPDPRVCSQLIVAPVPRPPVPLKAPGILVVHRHICRQNTETHFFLKV